MAQHVIPAAQLVPKYHSIERCNNYSVLQSIPCSPECKIIGQILLDHLLSYALTATIDVPVVYLQQIWRTVSKVPGPEETIKFMLNTQEFVYNVDMFRNILHSLMETRDNPFVTPVNIETIEAFMNRDDIPLVSVYTTRDVHVRGMLISNEFLTEEICATDDFKEYETVFMNVDVSINQSQLVVSTQGTHRLKPRSQKDNPEHVDDDDDKDDEKKYHILFLKNLMHRNQRLSKNFSRITYKAMLFKFTLPGDDIHSHHDDHQEDDAPLEGEKRVKRQGFEKIKQQQQHERDAWVEEIMIDEDEVIPEDETLELIIEFQDVDKRVPIIYDYERMRDTLNDALENQIVWESRKEEIRRPVSGPLVFFRPQRNPNELPRYLYNKDLFFLKYGNTEEKKYILSLYKIHAKQFPKADLEEKMNRWVRKEFKTFNEESRFLFQCWKDSMHKMMYKQKQKRVRNNPEDYFSKHRITEVVSITTDQPHGLNFMEQILVMRENDKPNSFSEADFKYLNKNNQFNCTNYDISWY
nr:hypothetical protein [Tanacetum cinerariifolium]